MIPYATCMCPGRRFRSWTVVGSNAQGRGSAVVQRLPGNCLCIKMNDSPGRRAEDREEGEGEDGQVPARVGPPGVAPFRTLRKRRPGRPIIAPRTYRLCLLDTCYNRTTDRLLSRSDRWAFNTFNLDVATGGRSLSVLLVHLFRTYGLVEAFRLDAVKVWRCFGIMEATYHSHNPYHNSVHAADVAQAMHCFLAEKKISAHLTPTEAMSALIAAVGHDLDHPGVNQPFLVATCNHLVELYQCSSVLENHHWRIAVSCLKESGVFDHLDKATWDDIQWRVRSLILATDITRQQKFLARFKIHLENQTLDTEEKDDRHFTLQIALKCADLCNPCRPWSISQRWSHQVCQEFYRQGDYERQLNLPATPTFDRQRTTVAKIQADFFKFIVTPLFETWHRFLDSSLSTQLVFNLHHNHRRWKKRLERERDQAHLPSPADEAAPPFPEDPTESEIPFTQPVGDSLDLETPTEELDPTTSVVSLTDHNRALRLRRVRVISRVETRFFKPGRRPKPGDEDECVDGCCTPPQDKAAATWCWRISRSLSEERPQLPSKEFDSPAHSRKGSVYGAGRRRGSAPVATGRYAPYPSEAEACGGLRGGGRRWSVPSEPTSGTLDPAGLEWNGEPHGRRGFALPDLRPASVDRKREPGGPEKSAGTEDEGRAPLLAGFSAVLSRAAQTGRRGSLPADLFVSSPRSRARPEGRDRRRSAGEVLSVLLGSAGTVTGLRGLEAASKGLVSYRRRGSDGLELLYGVWRCGRADFGGRVVTGRYRLAPSSDVPDRSPKIEDLGRFCTNYSFSGSPGISAPEERPYHRRASVPVTGAYGSLGDGTS
ncbi:uncharacterized protein LOC111622370 isoform X2 [Centruroides sculpturatus]|uniref:uncharacterized protein LOC111622370 isoform X2 n=1 Tax=Centruroides sculpturatus TaxID=218467 RepID=UPI000C6CAEF8|nr:uncharacterized protein LOC111622370 isoform X2 [Centruroides sculpturatus]